MIKRAKKSDIVNILPLVEKFISESSWGWTYDQQASIDILKNYIEADDTDVFMAVDDGIVGFATVAFDNEFHKERIGFISKFYMGKRGTEMTRKLVNTCCDWFDYHQCTDIFVTSTANIDSEDGLFENLMGKFGFSGCGQTMVRHK